MKTQKDMKSQSKHCITTLALKLLTNWEHVKENLSEIIMKNSQKVLNEILVCNVGLHNHKIHN